MIGSTMSLGAPVFCICSSDTIICCITTLATVPGGGSFIAASGNRFRSTAERAVRRARVDAALDNMRIDGGVDAFCRKLTLHGYDRGATEALSSFLKTGCNFEAVVIALARSAVLMQRHRELATVLDALDQQSDPRYWSEAMRTYVATGKGSARKLLSIQPRFWRLHV